LFHLCEATTWAVLPIQGGLYDQHPKLIDDWSIIIRVKATEEARRTAEQERKLNQQRGRKR
jgi:hypothetical protein